MIIYHTPSLVHEQQNKAVAALAAAHGSPC
jgi:uncharacterized protein YoaH (UPF0181 family)